MRGPLIRFILTSALALLPFSADLPAYAQGATQATVVGTCGTASYTAGTNKNITQDTTGVTCTSSSGGGGGNVTIVAPLGTQNIAGSVATTIGNGTDVVEGQQADAASCPSASSKTIAGCMAQLHLDATAGVAAPASTFPSSAIGTGCRAATTNPTAVTDGQLAANMCSKTGKTVVDIFAPSDLRVSGTTTSTNTAAHTIIAAGAGSLKNYITDVQCGRTDAGTSPIVVTFSDAQSSIMIIPDAGNGGGNNFHLSSPLVTAAATAFTMTSGTGVTTLYCNAQGYQAP